MCERPPFARLWRASAARLRGTHPRPPTGGRSHINDPCGKAPRRAGAPTEGDPLRGEARVRLILLAGAGLVVAAARWRYAPWPGPAPGGALELIQFGEPFLYGALAFWYAAAPAVAVVLSGSVAAALWRVWGPDAGRGTKRGALPPWPAPGESEPHLVIGELHHPTRAEESPRPEWLVVPAKGLFTGVAVIGAVGSGKTASCMRPFAEQLLSWRAADEERRCAALVLEVKGNFCYQVQAILGACERAEDYVELALDDPASGRRGGWSWNPLDAPHMDAYSLAYQVASLLNQLFGKGKEPFWQQAYTNLLRNLIELHRIPGVGSRGSWVTLRDLYRCAIDPDLFAKRLEEADLAIAQAEWMRTAVRQDDLPALAAAGSEDDPPDAWDWRAEADGWLSAKVDAARVRTIRHAGVEARPWQDDEAAPGPDAEQLLEPVRRWYDHDWMALDLKLRTSIVEGISSFLGLFDDPRVAAVFCPPAPDPTGRTGAAGRVPLPPLGQLIERGKVLALNVPAGSNPSLARAVGTMLKTNWLQSVQARPAAMARPENEGRYWRAAVFLCDEYQSFATVGESDPAGDEKAFSVTREARCIPIVATQSISSLKSATHGAEAWRVLLQALRTQIYLSLSDPASAKLASEACGTDERLKPGYSISESAGRAGVSLTSGRAGGTRSSISTSKNYNPRREPRFEPADFGALGTCEAIVLPFDGLRARPPVRCYTKPYFLPRELGYWEAKRRGDL